MQRCVNDTLTAKYERINSVKADIIQCALYTSVIYSYLPIGRIYTPTLNELGQLVPDPLRSSWARPAHQSVTPVPAHWRQHCESSPLRTSALAGHVAWTAVVTGLKVTDIDYQKRSHHCLQHLHWQITQRLQQQHRLDFTSCSLGGLLMIISPVITIHRRAYVFLDVAPVIRPQADGSQRGLLR